MFEKEAEERTKQYMNEHAENYNCENTKLETDNYNTGREYGYEDGFKDGAEFGYNKANEWHRQDIDDIYDFILKDREDKYFVCIMKDKSRTTAIGNCCECCNGEVRATLFFEYDGENHFLDDIVWWKEIIFPKESEEK